MAFVEKRAARVAGPVSLSVRAAVCRAYGPPEVVAVDDAPGARRSAPGQVRVARRRRRRQLPRRAAGGRTSTRSTVPTAVRARAASSPAWSTEVADDVDGVAVGDRVVGHRRWSAPSPRRWSSAADAVRRIPDGVDDRAWPPPSASPTAPPTTCSARWPRLQPGDELVVLGAGGGVGLAAVQLGAAARRHGDRGGVVGREARGGRRLRRHPPGRPPGRRPAPGAARAAARAAPTSVVDPVGGDLAEPALRSLRWGGRFVTVGYASGTIPRIPLNLVLLKGVQVLGFQFRRLRHPRRPTSSRRNEDELDGAAGRRAGSSPHIGASFPLDDAAAALRYVADGRAIGKVVLDVSPTSR